MTWGLFPWKPSHWVLLHEMVKGEFSALEEIGERGSKGICVM